MEFTAVATLNDATAVSLQTARSAAATIYIRKIVLSITTHANAKFVKVRDTASTPVVYAFKHDLTAAAGVPTVVTWDFGRKGVPITLGKDLEVVSEASGPAGFVYVEGYQRG